MPPTTRTDADHMLITGASGFIGSRFARAQALAGRKTLLLCRPASAHRLQRWIQRLPEGTPQPEVVLGDIRDPRLALAPPDLDLLRSRVGEIVHLAAGYRLDMSEAEAMAVNLQGTVHLLDLAEGLPGLRRFHHVSTIAVAGDFEGHFSEDALDEGQDFAHAYGRSKFLAEVEVRRRGLPATVYRPGVVVGDSQSGEIDKVDGAAFIFSTLDRLRRIPGATRLPMIVPRGDAARFHLVPIDFVVAAMGHLAGLSTSIGKTYHLTDPAPVSYRQFYTACLREMGFRGPLIARPVERLFKLLMKPALWPLTQAAGRMAGLPAEMLPHVIYRIEYDTRNTQADLAGSGIRCPAILSCLPTLIRYYENHLA